MKSNSSLPKFPASKAEWKRVIAAAPGEDRPLNRTEKTALKNAVVVKSGGYAAVRAALAEKQRQGEPPVIYPVSTVNKIDFDYTYPKVYNLMHDPYSDNANL